MFDDYESRFNCNNLLSELESLGTNNKQKLNDLYNSYEIESLVDNIKQNFLRDYKSGSIFTD